ncbi:MAG: hypothetical protein JJU31_09130 [Wenzhouxiangella sp.]|nr:hypothetical protein [Wenzhouxiangella sp.]MCH8477932.1 hypothetical protein [Wenzhouxiangella sp.]
MNGRQEGRSDRIADYLRGVLDEEATRQLELDMLEDPELFEQIQSQALLRQGLLDAEAEPASGKMTYRPAWAGWLWGGYVLAGSLALVVVGLGLRVHDLSQRLELVPAPSAGIQVLSLQTQRALLGPGKQTLPLAPPSDGLLIEIDVSARGDTAFKLVLKTDSGVTEWTAIQADERGYLTVFVPPGERATGLIVRDGAGQLVAEFP